MNHYQRNCLAAAVSMASSVLALSSYAADNEGFVLEEIIVTSQKRVESLQDVPISVSAIGGEKLAEAGIEKIADLTSFVPNLHMTESGLTTEIRVRGIGTGNNPGFEQSVGQYIDGIYYGRSQLIRAPFLDLERVEVLRGPQAILFGKNSIAGALNMTSAKPTDEFTASIGVAYEPEYHQREFNLMVSGALTDNLRGRVAYRANKEDGYVENTFLDTDEPNRDEQALRLTLAWDVSDDLEVTVKAERNTFDTKGRQVEIVRDDPNTTAHPLFGGRTYSQIGQIFYGAPGFESDQDFKRQSNTQDFSDNELYNYTVTADYQWGENTLTSISGWTGYEFDEVCDCDFTPINFFYTPIEENYDQFSQELRLTSPRGQTVEWIGGLFYQKSELETDGQLLWPNDSPGNSVLGANSTFGGTASERTNNQQTDAWAIFAQATWNVSDELRLTLGARYTEEDKEADRTLTVIDVDTGSPLTAADLNPAVFISGVGLVPVPYLTLWRAQLGIENHAVSGETSESAFTPTVNVQYDITSDIMLYASASEGFKSGGFDTRANTDASFEFDKEEATSYEIGAKTTLADGAAELNFALYYTEYENLQTSQFDGKVGFTVGNAKETVVQGFEVDGRWLLLDGLTLNYALSYLDFEYKDYTNGNCYQNQTPDGVVVNNIRRCDYTGETGGYAPKKTANIGLDYIYALVGDLELRSTLDMQYVDNHNVHTNLDPQYDIDAYTTVNLRIGLSTESWNVALLGKNLTDEDVLTFVGDAPLSGSSFGTQSRYGFVKPPRTVALEASYNF
jgi:iron complex outermembrane recepter protein